MLFQTSSRTGLQNLILQPLINSAYLALPIRTSGSKSAASASVLRLTQSRNIVEY
jgi:hypothetical protein